MTDTQKTVSIQVDKDVLKSARERLKHRNTTVENYVNADLKRLAGKQGRYARGKSHSVLINYIQLVLVLIWFVMTLFTASWGIPILPYVFVAILILQFIWWPISILAFDTLHIKWYQKI